MVMSKPNSIPTPCGRRRGREGGERRGGREGGERRGEGGGREKRGEGGGREKRQEGSREDMDPVSILKLTWKLASKYYF